MVNKEESYSLGKTIWQRTVKDMPQCFACCCSAGLILIILAALSIVHDININRKPLTFTHIDIQNDELVVMNSQHVIPPFVDTFDIERIGKIELISNLDSDDIHTLQKTTEEELEDHLRKLHAILLKTALVDRDGIGRISLADLKLNTGTKYIIIGIGGYYSLSGGYLSSQYIKLYYQFDVTDIITDYMLRYEKENAK
jgi:hypothetical protein